MRVLSAQEAGALGLDAPAGPRVLAPEEVKGLGLEDDDGISMGRSAVSALAHGASLGLGDKMVAGYKSLLKGTNYKDELADAEGTTATEKEANPITYKTAELAGSLAPAFAMGPARTVLGLAGQGAALGAVQGGAESKSDDVGGMLRDAGIGGVAGGVTGGVVGGVSKVLGAVAGKVVPWLKQLEEKYAGQVVKKYGERAGSDIAPAIAKGAAEGLPNVIVNDAAQAVAPAAAGPVSVGVSDLSAGTQQRLHRLLDEGARNPFESAARSKKVTELVKTIDANAGVHLGIDTHDPRFAEALADLPSQWWEGMARVSGTKNPSSTTVRDVANFFRSRAAQAGQAVETVAAPAAAPVIAEAGAVRLARRPPPNLSPVPSSAPVAPSPAPSSLMDQAFDFVQKRALKEAGTAVGAVFGHPFLGRAAGAAAEKLVDNPQAKLILTRQGLSSAQKLARLAVSQPAAVGKFALALRKAAADGPNAIAATHLVLSQDESYQDLMHQTEGEEPRR